MNAMGIIFASDREVKLNELTIHRTTASLPFGGRYRLIDFVLSNFVNSGVTRIGIIAKNNYNSLMDHIRMGRDWDLNRKNSGITVFPPFVRSTSGEVYKGKIEALYSNLSYIKEAKEDYVFIVNSNIAANIDFESAVEEMERTQSDVLIFTARMNYANSRRMCIQTNEENRITDILMSDVFIDEEHLVGINAYVIRRDLLCFLIETAYAKSCIDFEKDILQAQVKNMKMLSYEIHEYVALIDDIKSYFKASMSLLDKSVRDDLFHKFGNVFTKVKDSSPTVYGENAKVKNSLIADGCVIDGTVENSILFRGVTVGKGAHISNSIVMEHSKVGDGGKLSYVITDKSVVVSSNCSLSGFATYPIVIVKGKTV